MNIIMIGVSSDIGYEMAQRWHKAGHEIYGTYRSWDDRLDKIDIDLLRLDLDNNGDVDWGIKELGKWCPDWDVMVICPGTQEPVGLFVDHDFDKWSDSIKINFTNQMRILHGLLPKRAKNAKVLLFAGGSMNRATKYYSAYTASKVALVRMTELLDLEIDDATFTIVGPGWVKTKIHDSTLKAKERAGDDYKRTVEQLASDRCTPMDKVLDCCDWILSQPKEVIGGRNISVVADEWGKRSLEVDLLADFDMYKMRRLECSHGHDHNHP